MLDEQFSLASNNRFASHQISGSSEKFGHGIIAYVHHRSIRKVMQHILREDPTADLRVEVNLHPNTWTIASATRANSDVYLIHNKKVVGRVDISAVRIPDHTDVNDAYIKLGDDASKRFFKEHPSVVMLGELYGVKYDAITGVFLRADKESDIAPFNETRIVDTMMFDIGCAHASFAEVEGFGAYPIGFKGDKLPYLIGSNNDACPLWFSERFMAGLIRFQPLCSTCLEIVTPDGVEYIKDGDLLLYDPVTRNLSVKTFDN